MPLTRDQLAQRAAQRLVQHDAVLFRQGLAFAMSEDQRFGRFRVNAALSALDLHHLHSVLLLL